MSAKAKNKTITLTIPSKLLERVNLTRRFNAWTNSCAIREIPNLKEMALTALDEYCQSFEDDIILNDQGGFAGDKLDVFTARFKQSMESVAA